MGLCWGLRLKGDLQWHAKLDPFSVETLACGGDAPCPVMACDDHKLRLRIKPVMRCLIVAVYRVACLEWVWWIVRSDEVKLGRLASSLLLETMPAKEDREYLWLFGKTSRLFEKGTVGIAVWSKWQSGSAVGNAATCCLNGNGSTGDCWAQLGEIQPDLSRKIYPLCCLLLIIFIQKVVTARLWTD